MVNDTNSEPPKLPNSLKTELKKSEEEATAPNIWERLRELQKKGEFKGEIKEIVPKDFNITQSPHYYVVDDLKKRSIKCVSCEIPHGGILEAHLLAKYKIEKGVLYLDGQPTNKTPPGFSVDSE